MLFYIGTVFFKTTDVKPKIYVAMAAVRHSHGNSCNISKATDLCYSSIRH